MSTRTLTAGTGINVADNGTLVTVKGIGHGARPKTGKWNIAPISMDGGWNSNYQFTEARLYAVPFPVAISGTLDRLGTTVSGAGSAGAVIRFGIYTGDSGPTDLLLDAGTATATSAFAHVTVTISQAVTAGTLYWLALAVQGGAVTRPGIEYTNQTTGAGLRQVSGLAWFDNPNDATWAQYGFYVDSVTGALPDPFGTFSVSSTDQYATPIVAARWA